MASIFTRIIQGEIPCYKVAEDDRFFAFLDINPLAKGHCLVVPKKEVDYLFDLDDELFAAFHLFSKNVITSYSIHYTKLYEMGLRLLEWEKVVFSPDERQWMPQFLQTHPGSA